MKPLNTTFVMFCLAITQSSVAAGLQPYTGPDFVATQQTSDQSAEPSKGTVYFSKAGNRVEFDTPIGKTMAGADFNTGKCWFASAGQKIYMEGDIDKKTGDCSADLNMGPPGGEIVGGLMANEPCEGFASKKKMGNKNAAGRTTEQWGCRDPRAGEAMHWYDAKLKLVVKEETPYTKDELINIRFKKVDPGLFKTPKGFKRVDKNQFMQALMSAAMPTR